MRRVAIDLVPIRVGEGGTGSGIWTHGRELIHHLDALNHPDMEVVCLANKGQLPYLSGLKNTRLICFSTLGKNIFARLFWIHVILPFVCLFHRIHILHKLATETPLLCPAKRVTTVNDFYYEFVLENREPGKIRFYERLENMYFTLVTRVCFAKSYAILAISEATKREAVQRYPSASKRMRTIHLSAKPSLKNSSPIPTKPFTILCVAKFMEHKGQHLLIDAFDALLEQSPEVKGSVQLVLRGFHNDADYYRLITEKASTNQNSNCISMVGFNAKDSLTEIYAGSHLVVLLSSYEGFGLPVLEAQAMGLPVLCSDLPVLQEVGGEGAVYVRSSDVQAVAGALRRFITDSTYYSEMQSKALANVERFSWSETAKQTLEIYRHI